MTTISKEKAPIVAALASAMMTVMMKAIEENELHFTEAVFAAGIAVNGVGKVAAIRRGCQPKDLMDEVTKAVAEGMAHKGLTMRGFKTKEEMEAFLREHGMSEA